MGKCVVIQQFVDKDTGGLQTVGSVVIYETARANSLVKKGYVKILKEEQTEDKGEE